MARAEADDGTAPGVSLALDARFRQIAAVLPRTGSPAARAWGTSMAAVLKDRGARAALIAGEARQPTVPPGMPIGSLSGDGIDE
jgi:hypothetical protein